MPSCVVVAFQGTSRRIKSAISEPEKRLGMFGNV